MSTYAARSWSALGTYVDLVVADARLLEAAHAAAVEVLDHVDRTCSRFRPDSDLTRANLGAGGWVAVDPLLVHAVEAALEAARATGGLVDPALGRAIVAAGYDDHYEVVAARPERTGTAQAPQALQALQALQAPQVLGTPGPADLPPAPVEATWRDVGVDAAGAVRVPSGLALDLGATGKAFAADLVATTVRGMLGTDLVVSLGGDVAATGTHRWQVDVAERPDEPPAERLVLAGGGLATSSTRARRWHQAGRVAHHLLDPRTGRPVEEVYRTVSVLARTCLAANTASTAALVLGADAASWLARRGHAARLVDRSGVVTHVGRWTGRLAAVGSLEAAQPAR